MAAVVLSPAMSGDEGMRNVHPFFARNKGIPSTPESRSSIADSATGDSNGHTTECAFPEDAPTSAPNISCMPKLHDSKRESQSSQQDRELKRRKIEEDAPPARVQTIIQVVIPQTDRSSTAQIRFENTRTVLVDENGTAAITTGARGDLHARPSAQSPLLPLAPAEHCSDNNEFADNLDNGSAAAHSASPVESLASAENGLSLQPPLMLKLKGGKLASPRSQKTNVAEEPITETDGKAIRRRKKKPKNLIAILKYPAATDRLAFGARINDILSRHERVQPTYQRKIGTTTPQRKKPEAEGPPKPTHPFFRGGPLLLNDLRDKAQEHDRSDAASKLSPRRASAVTPGKLRAQIEAERGQSRQPVFNSSLSTKRLTANKQSGMRDPSWPTFDNVHVRQLDANSHISKESPRMLFSSIERRKGKQVLPKVNGKENILKCLEERVRSMLSLGAPGGPPSVSAVGANTTASDAVFLRKPGRCLTSGPDLQRRLISQLRIPENELSRRSPTIVSAAPIATQLHPCSRNLYLDLETYLTPFHRFEYESRLWASKYAPTTAEDVLQPGKEAEILRDWLGKMTVTAVQKSSKRSNASVTSGTINGVKNKPEKRKKRKRAPELDDFIVSSEDEGHVALEDFAELEREASANSLQDKCSIVRGGIDVLNKKSSTGSMASTILLSGPNGCGKSAAVYAVARELDFEVFEINSGSRRSGKDVLDRIGDMTENHLVQRVSRALADPKLATDSKPADVERPVNIKEIDKEAPQLEMRQNKLASFFNLVGDKPGPSSSAEIRGQKKRFHNVEDPFPRQRKQQKQSLILFEEVDVVFEEDKQFLMTVLTLAINSKRPIILTCNDENLVPIDSLTLHAILRFHPPPVNLAVDYLLLLAAHEGHVLQRSAVQDLYISRYRDLRGCIMELNFWCQMAVGDSNGGLDWLFQRWPPGSDVDDQGNTLRVVSEGTYSTDMGWFNHENEPSSGFHPLDSLDPLNACPLSLDLRAEVCKEWVTEVEEAHPIHTNGLRADNSTNTNPPPPSSLDTFLAHSDFLSAADLYCNLAKEQRPSLDCSFPDLSDKMRVNHANLPSHHLLVDEPPINFDEMNNRWAFANFAMIETYFQRLPVHSSLGLVRQAMPTTQGYTEMILAARARRSASNAQLNRNHFSNAMDALAVETNLAASTSSTTSLFLSSLDREFQVVSADIAPYVRIIASYDLMLEQERMKMSNLLSIGGKGVKVRKTRAARSALEGGKRETTRRERWFGPDVDLELVMSTGSKEWAGCSAQSTTGLRPEEEQLEGMDEC